MLIPIEPVTLYRTADGLLFNRPQDAESHISEDQLRHEYEAEGMTYAGFMEVLDWMERRPSLAKRMVALATMGDVE